jgi:hypothetical protein
MILQGAPDIASTGTALNGHDQLVAHHGQLLNFCIDGAHA